MKAAPPARCSPNPTRRATGCCSSIARARRSRSCASGTSAVSRRTPDYHALLLLNLVLGGQFVSRLNMNLREHKGYTYGARSWFEFRLGRGPFQMSASVQTDVTADAIREALGEVSAMRGDRPVTVDELETARAALTRGYPRNFETADQVARSRRAAGAVRAARRLLRDLRAARRGARARRDPRRRGPASPSRSSRHAGRRGQGASRRARSAVSRSAPRR